jgi:hypothetical protein
MMQLDTIPGRSERGLRWYLSPDDPSNMTQLIDWREMSDYQLCYWYCLEIEHRMDVYADFVTHEGGTYASCTAEQVSTWHGLYGLIEALDLPLPTGKGFLRLIKNKHKRINSQSKYKKSLGLDIRFQKEEREVSENTRKTDNHLLTRCDKRSREGATAS